MKKKHNESTPKPLSNHQWLGHFYAHIYPASTLDIETIKLIAEKTNHPKRNEIISDCIERLRRTIVQHSFRDRCLGKGNKNPSDNEERQEFAAVLDAMWSDANSQELLQKETKLRQLFGEALSAYEAGQESQIETINALMTELSETIKELIQI